MPDVPQLHFGNLTQGVVVGPVLTVLEQRQFTDQFFAGGSPQNVELDFAGGRGRTQHTDAFRVGQYGVGVGMSV
ncbi:MAG: hypothetical protein OXL37_17070 [Chloroflexota bacterium]|nr:hypothetical protein [Chloroflexota bacterium]MDE2960421.1 hypothetical protein [Chloroflexota bacterium]